MENSSPKTLFLQELLDMELYFYNQDKSGKILHKSSELSETARNNGNQLYKQKSHDKQTHLNILSHYTRSIAFAPRDDEKLALGYSNRSALLMHLCRYEECVIDIDRALKITKSEELVSKLNDRKERCSVLFRKSKAKEEALHKSLKTLKLSDDLTANTVFELPSVIQSDKALRIYKSVHLEYNKTYGRHWMAKKDIKPGEIIITEKSYASFAKIDQIYLVCSHCLTFAWTGIPCDLCAYSVYCSETCKKTAWQEYHDVECSVLPYLYSDANAYITVEVALATRMFIKAVKAEGFQNVISQAQAVNHNDNGIKRFLSDISLGESKFGTCYSLQSTPNKRDVNEESTFYEGMIVYILYKFTDIIYKEEKPEIMKISDDYVFILKDIFMKLADIINLNQFCYQLGCVCPSIMNECKNDCDLFRGHFIAPFSSLLNHSCIPNVIMLCLPQQKIVLYATQPIKKGEQLFYSYGPMLDASEITDRRQFLVDHYYFTCQCTACKENWKFGSSNPLSKIDRNIYVKLMLEFQQILHNAQNFNKNQFLSNLPNDWQLIDEPSLRQALKLSELSYKYFKDQPAFDCNCRYKRYIRRAIYKLYGEKYDMPNQC